jgi:hypothetical protein
VAPTYSPLFVFVRNECSSLGLQNPAQRTTVVDVTPLPSSPLLQKSAWLYFVWHPKTEMDVNKGTRVWDRRGIPQKARSAHFVVFRLHYVIVHIMIHI